MSSGRSIILFCCAALLSGCRPDLAMAERGCTLVNRLPVIKPDYAGITIPPNIAPLNFTLRDSCAACVAEIASVNGSPVVAKGKKGTVRIDAGPWKRLLAENAGKPLRITIYARGERGRWRRYATIEDTIAAKPVDRYCTYRLLNFMYNYSSDLRECQRDLTSFDETVLVNSQNYAWGCVNCHMPMNNDPGRFVLQSRSKAFGSETLIADGDAITTLSSRLGYTAWHPEGTYIAFSVYKVEQYFHAVGRQFIDVCDNNSYIVIYDVAARKIVAAPQLNRQGTLETWPAWSPDGRYLYFCSASVPSGYFTTEPPENFDKIQYSLLRIAFDGARNCWGAVDTMLTPRETGLSIAQPKLSPDNRFCLFCMQTSGAYPHTQVSSDLYLMDIATRQYRKLPINSEYNESWHSWSKNGRWILFSSKRGGGIFTRLYFSHVDSAGNAHKPFLLPQRDGAFYDSFIKCYNVPEFAVAPVRFSERRLLKAIRTRRTIAVPIPTKTAKTPAYPSPASWSSTGDFQ
ncbi:MAG: PD40 domain-containing protein [Chitinispirillaceae bacterium]|nr:PD40 domain-containing protein [Chitinispirillaceae bacterium]